MSDPTVATDVEELRDALEVAWGIICNAGGSHWSRESPEWQAAAARFRTQYFALLPSAPTVNAIDSLLATTIPNPPPSHRAFSHFPLWLQRILHVT